MSEWYISRNGTQHGPMTAKKLKELAEASRLQPTDQVCANGAWVAAGKVVGLIYDVACGEAVVNIFWQGAGGLVDMSVAVRFDGNFLGNGSLIKGFQFNVPTTIGRHTLGVKLAFPLKREKQYVLDVQQAAVYNTVLSYNLFWGNFEGNCSFGLDGQVAQAEACVQQQWDAEREISRCPSCGKEWVVEFLGEKTVNREQSWQTVPQLEEQLLPNPDYPFNSTLQFIPHLATKHVQKVVVVETIRDYFQCEHCSRKWKKDRTEKYIP